MLLICISFMSIDIFSVATHLATALVDYTEKKSVIL